MGLVSWLMAGIFHDRGRYRTLVSSRSSGAKVLAWTGIFARSVAVDGLGDGGIPSRPFTSRYWNATAVSTAFWFLASGVFLMVSAAPRDDRNELAEASR